MRDPEILTRIQSLAIPPAYDDVWICPLENGHLQATGRDAKGRKQYRYHQQWTELAAESKFQHMLHFARALPRIRERVNHDLSKRGLPREKVLASVVWFLETGLIRIGHEEYTRENKSYGLTTLRTRHCKIEGSIVQLRFTGKSGIKREVALDDRRMARIVRRIQDLPGQELFQYLDEGGSSRSVSSADVNHYLDDIGSEHISAKDFRTWAATVCVFEELSRIHGLTGRQARAAVSAAIKAAAKRLGNTPAICRKSYVHPGLISAFVDGSLHVFLESRQTRKDACEKVGLSEIERATVAFLKAFENK